MLFSVLKRYVWGRIPPLTKTVLSFSIGRAIDDVSTFIAKPLSVASWNESFMTSYTSFPSFPNLIFFSVDFVPKGRVQFRLLGLNDEDEMIAVHSAIMDRLMGRVENMAGTVIVIGQAGTIRVIGTFFPRKLF